MDEKLLLPARLDSAAAQALTEDLIALRGQPLILDATQVGFAGALGLQSLAAARREWAGAGLAFQLCDASDALLEACRMLGVAPGEIGVLPGAEVAA